MTGYRALLAHPEFRNGVLQTSPQMLGLASWGLMTGVAMVKSGLSLPEVLAMTLFVYAGSAQLAALPLLVAGAPAWVVLATGFCVNLRFVVFSLHLRDYMMHLPLARRLLAGYFTVDMTYVLLTHRFPQPADEAAGRQAQDAFLLGANILSWVCWMVPSLLGVLLANSIPAQWGLGFAGILALLGILCALATERMRLLACAVAGAAAVAAYALPFRLNIVAAIGIAVVACLLLEKRPPAEAARP